MHKSDLTKEVAARCPELTQAQAKLAVDTAIEVINDSISKGENVALDGLGQFKLSDRAGRTGRNPATGEPIEVAATRVVSFKSARRLKASAKASMS